MIVIVSLISDTIDEAVWKILEGKRETEIDVVEAGTMTQANEAAVITDSSLKRWMHGESAALEHV